MFQDVFSGVSSFFPRVVFVFRIGITPQWHRNVASYQGVLRIGITLHQYGMEVLRDTRLCFKVCSKCFGLPPRVSLVFRIGINVAKISECASNQENASPIWDRSGTR